MIPLSTTVIEQKNSLGSTDPILLLLELSIPSLVDNIRIVRNNEMITWRSLDWQPFPFELDEISETTTGEIPQLSITMGNASRVIEKYLIDYDAWLKANTHAPIIATLHIVSVADLANTTPIKTYEFEVSNFNTNAVKATFNLTQKNVYTMRFPPNRITRKCRFKFGSVECGVTPQAGQTCNKTLSDCRKYNNSVHFGGFPSVGGKLEKIINE